MLPPGLKSPREVVLYYEQVYFSLIDSGQASQCVYPFVSAGVAIVLVYLLIDHRQSILLQKLRWPIFIASTAFHVWCIQNMRARSAAAAFGLGLMCSWGILWILSIMIANDCQIDFERIQRSKSDAVEGSRVNGSAGNVANGGGKAPDQRKEFRNRKGTQANGHASPAPASDQRDKYFWQTYPSSFSMERLDWILDVFTNFRGIGWNWQTNGVPPPPAHVEAQLAGRTDAEGKDGTVRTSMTGVRRYSDRTKLLRAIAINLAYSYVALDVVKAIMHHDPYFWGE